MDIDCIPFKNTGYFSSLICDYIEEEPALKPFYNRFPSLENFKSQIEEKSAQFPEHNRVVLHSALLKQYEGTKTSKKTRQHIEQLANKSTFTVVTGHQWLRKTMTLRKLIISTSEERNYNGIKKVVVPWVDYKTKALKRYLKF